MEGDREKLKPPRADLFWTEPPKRRRGKGKRAKGTGMKDASIKELVVEWQKFHEWRKRNSALDLFRAVLCDGILQEAPPGRRL